MIKVDTSGVPWNLSFIIAGVLEFAKLLYFFFVCFSHIYRNGNAYALNLAIFWVTALIQTTDGVQNSIGLLFNSNIFFANKLFAFSLFDIDMKSKIHLWCSLIKLHCFG